MAPACGMRISKLWPRPYNVSAIWRIYLNGNSFIRMETKAKYQRRSSLALRLSLIVLAGTATIFFIAFGITYYSIRTILLHQAEIKTAHLASATQYKIESNLHSVMGMTVPLQTTLRHEIPSEKTIFRYLTDLVQESDLVAGASIAFEPYRIDADKKYYAPYAFEMNGEIETTMLGGDDFHYFVREWYQIPKETGKAFWTDPYLAEGGLGEIISTYCVPLFLNDEFIGVLALDITLRRLTEIVEEVSVFESGFAFLSSSTGTFITYPVAEYVMRESFFSLAEIWDEPELRVLGREITIEDAENFRRLPMALLGEAAWIYFLAIPSAEWNIGVIIPESELFSDIAELFRIILWISVGGFLLLLLVIVWISRSITHPIKLLARTAGQIAKGNLDEALPSSRNKDEVGELTHSFNEMRVALKDYINNLTETTKAKERIESELKIARNIQQSFLPKRYTLPNNLDKVLDLHANLVPAREVGGDLYDFFLTDDTHLYFAIGDVSGKGVPAALFMAVTKTLVKGIAEQYSNPLDILEKVNRELCFHNDNAMFVTYLCGKLDLHTGKLQLVNAGHNPPLLGRRDQPFDYLRLKPGLVLGAMEDTVFSTEELVLQPGDTLLLYTDGIVEAINEEGGFYGESKLLDEANALRNKKSQQIVNSLEKSVFSFAGKAEQADDITILALRYNGKR